MVRRIRAYACEAPSPLMRRSWSVLLSHRQRRGVLYTCVPSFGWAEAEYYVVHSPMFLLIPCPPRAAFPLLACRPYYCRVVFHGVGLDALCLDLVLTKLFVWIVIASHVYQSHTQHYCNRWLSRFSISRRGKLTRSHIGLVVHVGAMVTK